MRNPPARLTIACGLLVLVLTLTAGLNGAERGLGTLVGAGETPSVAYFSRCAPGTYDIAFLGQHRRASLVLPLGQIDAQGRVVKLSWGRASVAVNLAPAALKEGDLDRALAATRDVLVRLVDSAGHVVRSLTRRVKS